MELRSRGRSAVTGGRMNVVANSASGRPGDVSGAVIDVCEPLTIHPR